ncbi:hypothetical protein S140_54 [Shewanella sp. phage 1/40]|uniref:exonuclease n=1 Tax=Shewanella sp. phage 1/40 TaxID=1458860 RepID=UPI0004F650B5|nr:exonuclease [Shewanella sp. phage 1/40]AHK11464.1 hypothetical protein S140_54 [Shewanella sp. phage 1/40]
MNFTFKVETTDSSRSEYEESDNKTTAVMQSFIRSKQNNTLFPQIQVKDLANKLSPDCINYIDGDGFAFKVASSVEEDYIEVVNNQTKEVQEFSNVSEWKGKSTKQGVITVDSYLGRENIKLEAKGLPTLSISDFTVDKRKRLKYEKGTTIDDIKFNNSLEVAKYFLDNWIDAVKIQTQVTLINITLGSGDCHRNLLDLPKDYKSNRVGERPLLLSDMRDYILQNYPSQNAPDMWETDEYVDMMALRAYYEYRKDGVVRAIKTSPDKDAKCTAGFLFDPTKTFHFNQPQVWLIHSSDKTVGELELVKSGMKFTGLMGTAYQCVISDSSDFYGSRLTMPPEMKPKDTYGDVAFYKDFINLKTPKEVLQKMVDKFFDFYPTGVRFTSHLGNNIDRDTLWWLQQCFACQYMLRSEDDKTKIEDLLVRFKVDYSKIVGNNKPKQVEFLEEEHLREEVNKYTENLETVISLLSDKSGKVADKAARLDEALKLLNDNKHFENLYQSN